MIDQLPPEILRSYLVPYLMFDEDRTLRCVNQSLSQSIPVVTKPHPLMAHRMKKQKECRSYYHHYSLQTSQLGLHRPPHSQPTMLLLQMFLITIIQYTFISFILILSLPILATFWYYCNLYYHYDESSLIQSSFNSILQTLLFSLPWTLPVSWSISGCVYCIILILWFPYVLRFMKISRQMDKITVIYVLCFAACTDGSVKHMSKNFICSCQ